MATTNDITQARDAIIAAITTAFGDNGELRTRLNEYLGVDGEHHAGGNGIYTAQVRNIARQENERARGAISQFPIFNGTEDEDPYYWIDRFEETYAAFGWGDGANDIDKRRTAGMCMHGIAFDWYNEAKGAHTSWDGTNDAAGFLFSFKSKFASPEKKARWLHQLNSIQQSKGETVEEYARKFRKLLRKATEANAMEDRVQVFYFVKGLKGSLGPKVEVFEPADLAEAIRKARAVERGNKLETENEITQTVISSLQESNLLQVPANNQIQNQRTTTFQATTNNRVTDSEIDDLTKQMNNLKINKLNRDIQELQQQLGGRRNNSNNNGNNRRATFGNQRNQLDLSNVLCFKCNQTGHYANSCSNTRNGA
jgi:hypothetical protein